MPDISSVSALVSSASSALEIAKLIKNSDVSLKDAEQKLKLADLIEALADVKVQSADIKQELYDKDQEILQLKQKLSIENELEYEAPYYWRLHDNGKKDGPFCQRCKDKDSKLIRLQKHDNGYWDCKSCGNGYHDNTFVPYRHEVDSDYEPSGWMG